MKPTLDATMSNNTEDGLEIGQIIEQIVNPESSNAQSILKQLGLAHCPDREQIHRDIENKILRPPRALPAHWLPNYQM